MTTPICVKCGREMFCAKNGVVVYHPFEHATPGPVQEQVGEWLVVDVDRMFEGAWKEGDIDFVMMADKYRCPDCGFEVVLGYGELMMATPFTQWTQEDLKRIVTKAEEAIEIKRK